MQRGLVKYDAACKALAAAKAVDEVLKVRSVHEALRAYAKQAKNKQLEIDASEIRIRAERRVGELMAAQRASVGLADGGDAARIARGKQSPEVVPTLAAAGIDKDLAKRARKLAAVPRDEFEAEVSEWRGRVSLENERVTTNLLARGARELEDDDENFEEELEPAAFEGAFLMRADTAAKMAVYSRGPVTKNVVAQTRKVITAWTKLLNNLENQLNKGKAQR